MLTLALLLDWLKKPHHGKHGIDHAGTPMAEKDQQEQHGPHPESSPDLGVGRPVGPGPMEDGGQDADAPGGPGMGAASSESESESEAGVAGEAADHDPGVFHVGGHNQGGEAPPPLG